MPRNTTNLKVGDRVIARGNYRDEQLGQYNYQGVQVITEVKRVNYPGTSGLWVKTDKETDYIDAVWFMPAKE